MRSLSIEQKSFYQVWISKITNMQKKLISLEEAGGGGGSKTFSSAFEPFITWITDFNKGLNVEKSTISSFLEPKLDFSTNVD